MALSWADLTDGERKWAREMLAVCYHEAGHAVAGVLLGGQIRAVAIADGKTFGVDGNTVYDDLSPERWPEVAYAGPWAEARFAAGRAPGMGDMFRVLESTGRGDNKVLCASGGTMAGSHVVPLLQRCWPSVIALARKLIRSGEARHADVCAALRIPAEDNGFHLSLIRSGSKPGSFSVTPPRGT
jgi:hypothetical protein